MSKQNGSLALPDSMDIIVFDNDVEQYAHKCINEGKYTIEQLHGIAGRAEVISRRHLEMYTKAMRAVDEGKYHTPDDTMNHGSEVRKIIEAIESNRTGSTMYICLYGGNLEILVQPSTMIIDISKMPNEIGKPWVRFDPAVSDETPEEAAPYLWKLAKEAAA